MNKFSLKITDSVIFIFSCYQSQAMKILKLKIIGMFCEKDDVGTNRHCIRFHLASLILIINMNIIINNHNLLQKCTAQDFDSITFLSMQFKKLQQNLFHKLKDLN